MFCCLAASASEASSALSGSPGASNHEGKLLFHLCSQTALGTIPIRPKIADPDHGPLNAYPSWGGDFATDEGSSILPS